MSFDDTARINSDGEGKLRSIFLDWPSCGSLLEKKKFSSTCGLRSTTTATNANSTAVTKNINQCVPCQLIAKTSCASLRCATLKSLKLLNRLVWLNGARSCGEHNSPISS